MESPELTEELGNTLQLLACRLDILLQDHDSGRDVGELRRTRTWVSAALCTLRDIVDREEIGAILHLGVEGALRRLVDDIVRTNGACSELRLSGPVSHLPEQASMSVLRLVRLCTVDMQRRSRAMVVIVDVRVTADHVRISIRDDGVDLGQRCPGGWRSSTEMELAAMARDLASIGGRLLTAPFPPRGLQVRAVVPLRRSNAT